MLLEFFRVPQRARVTKALAAGLAEPRPLDLTLDVSKAMALLATPLPGVRETLAADVAWGMRAGKLAPLERRPNRRTPRSTGKDPR